MPLAAPPVPRRRLHTREIRYEGFLRADGLYELVARLVDVKDDDCTIASGLRRAGDPMHDMSVRVAFDADFNIVDVEASSDAVPYAGGCESIAPAYRRLIGLSLMQGFRNAVRDRVGGIEGCTHINELLTGLPTAAIQMRSGEVDETKGIDGNQPFQLDRCHALATTGETVQRYYPRWYRPGIQGQTLAGQGLTPSEGLTPNEGLTPKEGLTLTKGEGLTLNATLNAALNAADPQGPS